MPYTINGQPQTFPEPDVQDGTTYVPLGKIVETLGGYVTWDNMAKIVEVELGDRKVRVQDANEMVEAPEGQIALQSPPYVEDNALWVPVRFFQLVLGCTIQVDRQNVTISHSL